VTAVTAHYSGILGCKDNTTWAFNLDAIYGGRQRADAKALTTAFMEEAAWQVVRHISADSAPGLDGVGPGFYKAAWNNVKPAIMEFLEAFHSGRVDLQRINRAHIVLIPKCPGAVIPSSFRTVSLQNCPVKILTKVLTTRLQVQI